MLASRIDPGAEWGSRQVHQKKLLLVCDDPKGALGDVSLQLVRIGADAAYAPNLDEAELMARQEGRKVEALLVPADSSTERLDHILDVLGPVTGVSLDDIAVLGKRPSDQQVGVLREHGVRWRLWAPYDDRDLRFLIWGLIWAGTDHDLRIDVRIPTALPGQVTRRDERREVLVGDLSRSGAYLETPEPFPAGSQVEVAIALPAGDVSMRGVVRWVARPGSGPVRSRQSGFGIEFMDAPSAALRAVTEHLIAERDRFAL